MKLKSHKLTSMTFKLLPHGLLLASLLLVASVRAHAQNQPSDDMAQFMDDRGLIERVGEQAGRLGSQISDRASDLVVTAMGFLGVPYKRGGTSAETGFDCSGFVLAIYQQTVGLVLPRRSADQAAATVPIDKSELQPGDLVFFNTLRATFSHVGIYVGDHKFIHSPRTGAQVRVEDMRVSYWQTRFDGARRVPVTNKGTAASNTASTPMTSSVARSSAPKTAPAPAPAPVRAQTPSVYESQH
jgi:hypothetical protein